MAGRTILMFAMAAWPTALLGQTLFQEPGIDSESIDHDLAAESIVLRSRTAGFDRAMFTQSLANDTRLVLNLFPDTWLEATTSRSRSSSATYFVYADLRDGGHASLLPDGGIVRGEVHSAQGTYTIRSVDGEPGTTIVRITQLDETRLPTVDHGAFAPDFAGYPHRESADTASIALSPVDAAVADTETDATVDVLAFYTPAAEALEGGRAEVEAMIIGELEKTNQVLVNSGLGERAFRLTGIERVDYAASGFIGDSLGPFRLHKGGRDPDGVLDEVHAIREAHGADLAHLFIVGEYLQCGLAYTIDRLTRTVVSQHCPTDSFADPCVAALTIQLQRAWAFGVTAIQGNCLTIHAFPHELGHNLGLDHDRYDLRDELDVTDHRSFPVTPYGFGYLNQNFERTSCSGTVMSVSAQCRSMGRRFTRLPMLSDPDLAINDEGDVAGVAGDAWTEELDGPADAARAVDGIWNIMANLHRRSEIRHHVPFMPRGSDVEREGFVRVLNHDGRAGNVNITAYDDAGNPHGPITLTIDANRTTHFNSDDLEAGNADKGIPQGIGQGDGDWRLELTSTLDLEVLAYIRTPDGFLTAMHDLMPASGPGRRAPVFNPASNTRQVSLLRLVNTDEDEADVVVTGVDDNGMAGDSEVRLTIPPRAATTLTAQDLEVGGEGFEGALGNGDGKWRLFVEREWARAENTLPPTEDERQVFAMSLLRSPTGHLTNLSTMARNESSDGHAVPLFPAKSAEGRQGFVRIRNRSDEAGEANVLAFDDAGDEYGPVTLALRSGQTRHFNSDDLEDGNADKGLSGGIGEGHGDWRLRITSALDLEVLAYVRTDQGFLTSMHDAAPSRIHTHRLAVFNPAKNINQISSLRLVNTNDQTVEVAVTGVDDHGRTPGTDVHITIPARTARTVTVQSLEPGGDDFEGALAVGEGKWQLIVEASPPITTMSLLESPTGHLTNLSTAPVRGVGPWPAAHP